MKEIKFHNGDTVFVRDDEVDYHHRTPGYVKGKMGRVTAFSGFFHNPENRAHHGSGLPMIGLYRVEFQQNHLWDNYTGPTKDSLQMDIFEQWLAKL